MNKKAHILLTGGHAGTTAVAVIQAIRSREDTKDWELSWIGAHRAIEGKQVATLESVVLPKLGVSCYGITMGRLQRRFTRYTIPSLFKIPLGFVHALALLFSIKPSVVLSFGGYAAFPVVVMSWFLRIPVVIQEQVATAGRSSIFSARFATKIAISRETSERFFPKKKTVFTGNPVMKSIFGVNPKKKIGNPPVLFITGGSRGSQPVNDLVISLLPKLLEEFKIVHQTGTLDFDRMKLVKERLNFTLSKRYEVIETIPPLSMHEYYEKADIVLGRSGANTVCEVLATKRPAIFIPLPFAYNDEQTANAKYAEEFGIAKVLLQKDASPEKLYEILFNVRSKWSKMVSKVSHHESPDKNASEKVVELLAQYA